MKTILIIGGYGQFGSRLSRRLSTLKDHKVIVAGRSLQKAELLCRRYGGNLAALAFDLRGDISKQLSAIAPAIVIDAAGPFQPQFQSGYALARACITLGIHCIDLSDSGDFTAGITDLNADAQKAGVTILSGASSAPALSTAVIEAAGFETLKSVEAGISPGGRIDLGLSVTKAVLSYLGLPLRTYRGGNWETETGYSGAHSRVIAAEGMRPIKRRFGLCDAPDRLLLARQYESLETNRFYGSHELRPIHISLRLLAKLQGLGLVKTLERFGRLFARVGTWMGYLASDRGGMYMRLVGKDKSGTQTRIDWNLIAEHGDGPFIPILAPEILIKKWDAAPLAFGARPCIGEISLAEFETEFDTLSINSEFSPPAPSRPLFEQVLESEFATLPAPVRAGHELALFKSMTGTVTVRRGKNPLSNLIAAIAGFPRAKDGAPITVTIDARGDQEKWIRTIEGSKFTSVLTKGNKHGEVYERFGPAKFKMILRPDDGKLHYDIVGGAVFGIPLTRFLCPKSISHERAENGIFVFDVEIKLPFVGRMIHYVGTLK